MIKRISDETFKNSNFNYDDIVSIRIENGEFYFLGWMENGDGIKSKCCRIIPKES